MKDVKIVVGANYGDEGKGLLTRYFSLEAKKSGMNPIVVFHNGTAQRGHTVDYNPMFRHIYHHFGSGTGDGIPTFFADTFWVHPMEYVREYKELRSKGIQPPVSFCDPDARVVTPFDMLVDHATEAWIEYRFGQREFGSCGLGTWCATDRFPKATFTISDFKEHINSMRIECMLELACDACVEQLIKRGVEIDKLKDFKDFFNVSSGRKLFAIKHFIYDLLIFFENTKLVSFNELYEGDEFNSFVFENGQGLGLDKNNGSEWRTTSSTGIFNPACMLSGREDFNAEVCYVTRSYLTRHGFGSLEEETDRKEINPTINDRTNVTNDFQGALRFGYLESKEQAKRIDKDWSIVKDNSRFRKTMAITHCNEYEDTNKVAEYTSNNPYCVIKRD